jgi:hypothetical protein
MFINCDNQYFMEPVRITLFSSFNFFDIEIITEKPAEFEGEDLDPDDPDNLYFMYIATKQEDLVEKKRNSLKKKKEQRKDPNRRHKANRI